MAALAPLGMRFPCGIPAKLVPAARGMAILAMTAHGQDARATSSVPQIVCLNFAFSADRSYSYCRFFRRRPRVRWAEFDGEGRLASGHGGTPQIHIVSISCYATVVKRNPPWIEATKSHGKAKEACSVGVPLPPPGSAPARGMAILAMTAHGRHARVTSPRTKPRRRNPSSNSGGMTIGSDPGLSSGIFARVGRLYRTR